MVFHVAFGFGKELDATGLKEPFCQCFGDIASVSKDLAIEALKQVFDGLAVVGIARRDLDVEQLSLVIDHQVELESKEPVNRGFAPGRQAAKHLVASNPTVVAHLETAAIDKADAATSAKTVLQVHAQGQQSRRHPFHKAVVADQVRKGLSPVNTDMVAVERFEVSILLLMEAHQDCHDLAQAQ